MFIHAKGCCEIIVPAGSLGMMASFRAHHAEIALSKFSKTGVAISLAKALFGGSPAMNAVNHAAIG